ncbi:putative alpha-N-acetylgalactosaminide alpha-2 [Triplophysa rosa]|uniref:alpha-N-acetylgalactosaminide alpha-2,6-sialyltransferase n=1 Tax=Triplophysa rosa TaxID=992332 RepID=A0A9W7TR52_TRIRA|nr:putative alpha-N-acetylgalactosaminide alpha-2 [Triplophysa rosa]
MTIDAPVILSALFFTIIAIIVASSLLAKKSSPKKERQEERPDREVTESREEIPPVPVKIEEKIPPAPVKSEEKRPTAPPDLVPEVVEPTPVKEPTPLAPEPAPEQELPTPKPETLTALVEDPVAETTPEVPVPEPESVPLLESVPVPEPESVPSLEPESAPEPVPEQEAAPAREPETVPAPESVPVPEPGSAPAPEPESVPVPEPGSAPAPEPESVPVPEPKSAPEPKSTLSLLWHSSTSRLFERNTSHECVRCAVVGNGGILRGSGQGKVIDSHDYVFRVNAAIIKGFEDDVGTKTSFYGFTTNSLKNSFLAYHRDGFKTIPHDPGIRYIVIPAQTRDYVMLAAAIQGVSVPSGIDEGDRPSRYFGFNPQIHQFRMIHPHFIQYVTKRFLNSPQMEMYRDFYMPSTGAQMLLTALHTCDQVSAYGFMTDNYEDFSDHYYDSEYRPLVHYANHDLRMEGWLWKLLHTHKVMWLYQRYKKRSDVTHRKNSAHV